MRHAYVGLALLLAGPAAVRAADQAAWTPLETLERQDQVLALEDVDGDGLRDLFVFHTVEEASGGTLNCTVYRAGEPASPSSVLESHSWTDPDHLWWVAGAPGDATGGAGLDLFVYEYLSGAPPAWGGAVLPDFRDAESIAELVGVDGLDTTYPVVTAWGTPTSRYRGLDFDADGHDDFTSRAQFFSGAATGNLTAFDLVEDPSDIERMALVPDLSGDGLPDLVTVESTGRLSPNFLRIRRGGPSADLTVDVEFQLPDNLSFHDLAWLEDFDGDGDPDLALIVSGVYGGNPPRHVWVYRGGAALDGVADFEFNTGALQFARPGGIGDAGDLDADGDSELVMRDDPYGGTLYVFEGGSDADLLPDAWVRTGFYFPASVFPCAEPVGDWDADGTGELLFGDSVWSVHAIDLNEDGIDDFDQIGDVLEDCDGDGLPDNFEIWLRPTDDCDANGRLDLCELSEDPSLDCDNSGRLDVCQLNVSTDCDGSGRLDSCELQEDPSIDWDDNGTIDTCQLGDPFYNCNDNELLDAIELQIPRTWIDCDGNLHFDDCEIALGSGDDTDANGRLDVCQGPLKLSVVFDRAGTQTELSTPAQTPFEVFVVLEATTFVNASQIFELEFSVRHDPSVLILYEQAVDLAGCTDFEFEDPSAFRLRFNPAPNLSGGPVVLVRMTGQLIDPAEDVGIRLAGIADLPGTEVTPAVPFWRNWLAQPTLMSSFEPAWVNRVFEDCNGNGVDDQLEIDLQWVDDENQNQVPDACEATAAPPDAPLRRGVQVRPNPFNPRTTLHFAVEESGPVRLAVFDVNGRRVRRLLSRSLPRGPHAEVWDGTDDSGRPVASGVYFYSLETPGAHATGKLALVR